MPVPWSNFIPANVRACWKTGSNLSRSCTTSSYTGGNPSGPGDLKRSIVDPSGNLKKSITDRLDSDLVASVKPAKP